MINVTCIIPSLCSEKSYPILKNCINCLKEAEKKTNKIKVNIVLVTNGEKIVLKTLRQEINHLVRYKDKYSFSKMNNKAITYAVKHDKSDWIMFVNDDAFVDSNFFAIFINTLNKSKNAEIVSPLIYENRTNTIDSYGVEYFNSGYAKNNPKLSTKTQLATAACLLVKRSLLDAMESRYSFYFNEILISYMEDVDFTLRARALNKNIIKSKKMVVNHMVSFSNKRRSYYVMYQTYRNIIWLIIMNWPVRNILRNLHNIILVQLWVFVFSVLTKGPLMYIKIWIDTFKNIDKLLKIRHFVISSYDKKFRFREITSRYAFRSKHGYKIRLP